MIFFPLLRTRRLTIQLQELSIGDSLALANTPAGRNEAEITAFLRGAVKAVEKGPQDPADWTVQERTAAVAHYLCATGGEPDFQLGDGRFSDYFAGEDEKTPIGDINAGFCGGEEWTYRALTGRMAESIERLVGEVKFPDGRELPVRAHWIFGAMAYQMLNADAAPPTDETPDGQADEWCASRMKVFMAFPESVFGDLISLWITSRRKTDTLFSIDYSDEGIVALPKEGTAENLPPARFPARTCISAWAQGMV